MNHITYRKGIKFFNESRFHDAHEAWECHWLHMDDSPERRYLQGMLKVASALNKYEHERLSAAGKLLESGFHYLSENMSADMGIDKKMFLKKIEKLLSSLKTGFPIDKRDYPVIVWAK